MMAQPDPTKVAQTKDLSSMEARRGLVAVLLFSLIVVLYTHHQMPLAPHSSHDAFLVIPQLRQLLMGAVPDDARFGMFAPTWFSPHAVPTGALGWAGFWERVLGNVQSHTWIDAPHPMVLMALVAHWVGGGTWIPVLLQWFFLAVLLCSMYGIGVAVHSRRVGLTAAAMVVGTPGLLGATRYIEPHLAVVAISVALILALIHTDGLRNIRMCLVASMLMWTLSRSGEGSGEVVIAGLLVVGPLLVTIVQSDRSMAAGQWLLGLLALLLPFALMADFAWMIQAMERVTRAFADPVVQSDVAAKGGTLSHPVLWFGGYIVLACTDYFRPLMTALIVIGLLGWRRNAIQHKWLVWLWVAIPWLALSWMQRKASWYGLGLLPPVILVASIGLVQWKKPVLFSVGATVALVQMLTFSLIPAHAFPTGLSWLREPLALHEWRMRRVDWLRPMDSDADHQVRSDLDGLIEWMRQNEHPGPIAMVTMGTQHDYAARYHLSMALPGVGVINLTDPRLREARYRSLHPSDFTVFFFLDGGMSSWPPSQEQSQWLRDNLRCGPDEPLDSFLTAVTKRFLPSNEGFYPLRFQESEPLGAGQVWSGEPVEDGLCVQ